jgi:hypothetical protein
MNDTTDDKKPISKRQQRQTVEAAKIYTTPPTSEDIVFLARELILCTLPHSDPGDIPAWSRTNGHLTLTIRPGWNERKKEVYGYPYGTVPRLLLMWIVTEIIRTKSHRLELGSRFGDFLAALDLNVTNGTGKRSDARRAREQIERLFHSIISFDYSTEIRGFRRSAWLSMQIAPKGVLWWSDKDPDQNSLWGSWIEVSEDFFQAVMNSPCPLDIRVVRHIKDSSLGIDLYTILNREAYRAGNDGKPRFLAWEWLYKQTGNEYSNLHDFRRYALVQIKSIMAVHPGLLISIQKGRKGQQSGLVISNLSTPSIPPVPAREPIQADTNRTPPTLALVPPPPPSPLPPEKFLKLATVEKFRRLYPNLDPYACKAAFDYWAEGLPPEEKPRYYDRVFISFAEKWVVGKVVVSNP